MKKLGIVLGVLLVGMLAAFLWIRSWLTPEYLRAQVETQVKVYYRGKFSFGAIGYAFPLSVRIDDLLVADPSGEDEYLRVGSASASLEPWALFSREVHVTSFVLREPAVLLALDAANRLEMMRHVVLPESKEETTSSAAPALAVSELRVETAAIRLRMPGQPGMEIKPLDVRLSLLGDRLTLHEVTLTARGPIEGSLRLTGALEKLFTAPGGAFELSSAGLTLKAPDPNVSPIVTGPLQAKLKLEGSAAVVEQLRLDLWDGSVEARGRAAATGVDLKAAVKAVRAGQWLGPMLLARGLGEPLPALTLDVSEVAVSLKAVKAAGVRVAAGGLRVSGDVGLGLGGEAPVFAAGSALKGNFAGGDLATALALPDTELEGEIGVDMTLAGAVLAPTIRGKLSAPTLKVRRPGVFSLPVKELGGSFTFQDSALKVPDLAAKVIGGTLNASADADLKAIPPAYAFQLKGARFRIPEIFETLLVGSPFEQGELDLDFALEGAGADLQALVGEGKAAIRTARLANHPVADAVASKLDTKDLGAKELDGKFKIIEVSKGRVRLGDFSGTNGKLGPVTGDGSIGFDKTLAGKVGWKVPIPQDAGIKLLRGKILPVGLELGGTVEAPTLKVADIGKAVETMAKQEADRKLAAEKAKLQAKAEAKAKEKAAKVADKLLGKLGGNLGGAPASATSTGPAAPAPLKQELEKKAVGLLKGLFR